MIELRWVVRDQEKILQYRMATTAIDYSSLPEPGNVVPITKRVYGEWTDIDVVIEGDV